VAENKKVKKSFARVIVRVHIPDVETSLAVEIHDRIREVVADYPKAEVELSMLPLMPTR